MDKKNKEKKDELTLASLGDFVGSYSKKVAKNHIKELSSVSKELDYEDNNLKIPASYDKNKVQRDDDRTMEFRVYDVRGMRFEARVPKVIESFKIKPSLKKMVEEIVAEVNKDAKKNGFKTTKGKVYNRILAEGLRSLAEKK